MENGSPHDLAAATAERRRRDRLWTELNSAFPGAVDVPAKTLNDTRIFFGGQGCWVDKTLWTKTVEATYGVTVAVLHTGRHYPDDLGKDGLTYHYPSTGRQPGRDRSEIEATKNCGRFEIPLFVVTERPRDLRRVQRGWVLAWDDDRSTFFISFERPQQGADPVGKESFQGNADELETAWRRVLKRPGQQAFRFAIFTRYGQQCAFCDIRQLEMLDVMHIRDHSKSGAMHEMNGLPACKNHHAAFDAGLISIAPDDYRYESRKQDRSLASLGVTKESLRHLLRLPAHEFIEWAYSHKRKPESGL